MSFYEEVGRRIRSARQSIGMTQAELAEMLGVNTSCISQYETASRKPSLLNMSIMSDVFETSLDELVPCIDMDGMHKADACQTSIFDFIEGEDDAGQSQA